MPKLCDGCAFYSPENDRTVCPICDGPLKITFLPPPGEKAAPIAGLPTDPVAELSRRHRAEGGSRVNWLLVKAVAAVLVTATAAGVRLYLRQEARADREERVAAESGERVEPGIHILDAARMLDTGAGTHTPGTVRFRDRFTPDDDSTGTVTMNGLTVTWQNGYVTSVAHHGSGGGTRRRATVVTTDDDDEDDGSEVVMPTGPRVPKPDGKQ